MIDTAKFRKESQQLNKRIGEMRMAMYNEMVEHLRTCGGSEMITPTTDPSSGLRNIKGFRIGKDYAGKECLQLLLEDKSKPFVSLHNPHGHWYDMPNGWGFKTISIMSQYYELLIKN